jgi:hypothetical protein
VKKGLLAVVAIAGMAALALFLSGNREPSAALPTLAVLPSDTPSVTPTHTSTPTTTFTPTATETLTPTTTPTSTVTPTLGMLVLQITAVNPGAGIDPSPTATGYTTPTALPTVNVPPPPRTIPLAEQNAPTVGWVRYETADPAYRYVGRWFPFQAARASQGGFSYTTDPEARVSLPFSSAGLRVRYVANTLYGIFQIRIDGQLAAEIDSYRPQPAFLVSATFSLTQGQHTVEIVNTGRKNPASTGYVLALDSVEVYRSLPPTAAPTATPSAPPSPSPTPAPARVQRLAGPPTLQPTATDVPPGPVAASLVIAYDENGNHAVDPAEGVQGISARLVTVGTNQVVASGFTNAEGFVRLEALSAAPLRLVVPYFGKVWDVSSGRGAEARFTLLLPPGNQPGLIP